MPLWLTEEQIRIQQEKVHGKGTAKSRDTRQSAVVERCSGNVAETPNAIEKALPPVVIRFTHYRRRCADIDNLCTKFYIDGFVESGLLRDDNETQVKEVRHRQVKIEMWEMERIEVEFIQA